MCVENVPLLFFFAENTPFLRIVLFHKIGMIQEYSTSQTVVSKL